MGCSRDWPHTKQGLAALVGPFSVTSQSHSAVAACHAQTEPARHGAQRATALRPALTQQVGVQEEEGGEDPAVLQPGGPALVVHKLQQGADEEEGSGDHTVGMEGRWAGAAQTGSVRVRERQGQGGCLHSRWLSQQKKLGILCAPAAARMRKGVLCSQKAASAPGHLCSGGADSAQCARSSSSSSSSATLTRQTRPA